MIKLSLKEGFRDDRDAQSLADSEMIGAPISAALREAGIEIGPIDFCDAWSEFSFSMHAGWMSIDERYPASILFDILPYCDIEPGDPIADGLIAQLGAMNQEDYAREGYGLLSNLLGKR